MPMHCPNCGYSVDQQDRFCRQCGASLTQRSGARGMPGLTPENAAKLWKNFFWLRHKSLDPGWKKR
jgi:hypothetical protein